MENVAKISNPSNSSHLHRSLIRHSEAMATAAGVLTILIMLIGVLGNLLTIVAFLRHSKLRTVAAAFITSLCVSDLLFCFLVLPFSANQFFVGSWNHGDILCQMVPTLRYGCVGISLLSVAAISINRYILIANPSHYEQIYTKWKVALYIGFIWLFSYGIQIPILLGKWGKYAVDEKIGTCSIQEDSNGRNSKTALFVVGFALPCVIIVICYASIYWVVRKSSKRIQRHSTSAKSNRSEMKITKMVLVIFLSFLVCYLPLTIVKVFDADVKHAPLHVVAYLLIYMSCCVNPVVYVTMNRQYRVAYLETLKCNNNSNLDSQQPTLPPQSKSHLSVSYLKNIGVNHNCKA